MDSYSSDRMISRLGWGTGSSFGSILSDFEADSLIKLCLDSGLTVFDTGPSYAGGRSEQMLGRSLKSIGVSRERLAISTKIGSYASSCCGYSFTKKDYGRAMTCRLVEQSLVNLQTDYIDTLFFHSLPPGLSPPAETLDYLQSLKSSGVIRALGVSAHSINELRWVAENIDSFDVIMTHYNPITAPFVEGFLRLYKAAGKSVYGSSPYASGLLIDEVVMGGGGESRPVYGIFKRLRNWRRSSRMSKVYRQRLHDARRLVAEGAINPLCYSLSSGLVDVTIFGSLTASRIVNACASARIFNSITAS